jgi:hypothetical protein
MSRFGTYLRSQQLAKSYLISAGENLKESDHKGAIDMLIRAVREFQTATNCIASIQFQPRKKVYARKAARP